MTIFDLVFIAVFLASVVTIGTAVGQALLGHGRKAAALLARYAIGLAVYLAIVVIVSLVSPRRVLPVGQDRCFDDWCIGVADIRASPATSNGRGYTVTFRMRSRARGRPQRETGIAPYLLDAEGRRYDPVADTAAAPFDVTLSPGQSATATRRFEVPSGARDLGVVVAHEGSYGFPGLVIIGDEASLLHKKAVVPITE
jgi:hypothetical protein